MKANELRLGNCIRQEGKDYQLDENSLIDILDHWKIFKKVLFQPIPITKEWLEKFGFELWDINPPKWVLHNIIDGTSDFEITLQDGKAYASIDDNACCWAKELHVHHLQNLYYSLVGEELMMNIIDDDYYHK